MAKAVWRVALVAQLCSFAAGQWGTYPTPTPAPTPTPTYYPTPEPIPTWTPPPPPTYYPTPEPVPTWPAPPPAPVPAPEPVPAWPAPPPAPVPVPEPVPAWTPPPPSPCLPPCAPVSAPCTIGLPCAAACWCPPTPEPAIAPPPPPMPMPEPPPPPPSLPSDLACETQDQFSTLGNALTEACCSGTSRCVMGLPSECSQQCATVLLPVQAACEADGGYLVGTGGTGAQGLRSAIDAVAAMCSPIQLLPCAGTPPQCMPCVGDVIYQYAALCNAETSEWQCREREGCTSNGCIGRRIDGLGEACPSDACAGYPPSYSHCENGDWVCADGSSPYHQTTGGGCPDSSGH